MTHVRSLFLLSLLTATASLAQSGLELMDVDVMFVGAHPDDDTGILATFARYLLDEGFRGTVVTATGGDGGGNAIGPEAGPSLALIRKEEERRALALVGVDSPSFLGLPDFYFTLSAEEAERKWGKSFVCDVVRHVRLERPEVIVTMWPGPGTHGQHQMAARAATIAFEKAGDPAYCPEQIEQEFLRPFTPLKLYYYDRGGPTAVEIGTADYSKSLYRSYAEIKALGVSMYRSQGFDRLAKVPVDTPTPERFLLVRSRVPVSLPESHLLSGATPPGVQLRVEPDSFRTGAGVPMAIEVKIANAGSSRLQDVELSIVPPPEWSLEGKASTFPSISPGESAFARFRVTPTPKAVRDQNQRLVAAYRAHDSERAVAGENFTWVQAGAPVEVRFSPLFDVADYRKFARETRTDWVIETLPTRVPLVIGRTNDVAVSASNASGSEARVQPELDLPPGITQAEPLSLELRGGSAVDASLRLRVDGRVLTGSRHSARVPVKIRTDALGLSSEDVGEVYALPALEVPRVAAAPKIDGDLSDLSAFARGEISNEDLWWRKKPDGPADSSAVFFLAYDSENLYAGVEVRDDVVVCNIPPDDIKAQLRSDAVGITVDPSGASRDTSTVLQAAAFPCTTEGFAARGFRDADANQGLMEETAPGMEVASRKLERGYTLEAKIPWAAMPHQPRPGDEIGLNIVIYDGDAKDARVGANVSESGIAWAAFEWGGKQALPYLWPRVRLGR
ncbi:MAG TPA: PIG-L family deacetylase [Vicinamibacteria bacterium]